MLTAFIIVLIILVLVIVFVTWPLFKEDQPQSSAVTIQPTGGEYEEFLQQLRDLDFDRQSGKVSDEDYPMMRESLLAQAANALAARQAVATPKQKSK